MVNGRMVGAAALALVMATGATSSLALAQAAKKKSAAKGAAAGPVPTAAEVASAEEGYKTKCAVCHTPDGNSPIEQMNFSDGVWKHGSSVKELMTTISEGVAGTDLRRGQSQLTPGESAPHARNVP